MLCSIVIPIYNKACFIEATLRSVLKQTHRDFEVLVVDDGSTDDSANRVRALTDPRIRLITQSNQGVSCARNAGIAAAAGELVCFLDADDCYHPGYLETVVQMANTYLEQAVFSTGFRLVWDEDLEAALADVKRSAAPRPVHDFFTEWRKKPMFCTNSVAVRREALLALQPCFPPGEAMAEDQDLWFRLVERHGVLHCDSALVAYRMNVESSLSAIGYAQSRNSGRLQPAYLRLEQRARAGQMPGHHVQPALRLVADKKTTLARSALATGRRGEALARLLRIEHGLGLRRWWVTLVLCLTGRTRWIQDWENMRRRQLLRQPQFDKEAR